MSALWEWQLLVTVRRSELGWHASHGQFRSTSTIAPELAARAAVAKATRPHVTWEVVDAKVVGNTPDGQQIVGVTIREVFP